MGALEREKHVDESWKETVETEKETFNEGPGEAVLGPGQKEPAPEGQASELQINFINYVTSLTFQALIFLGEIPHPAEENKIEINLPQAKFVIDTLIVIREKTKGNLTPEEDNLLNASIYELQVKFVEQSKRKEPS